MRKSVIWSAVFLAAILLGLCGRLPLVRGDKPAVHKRAPVGEGQDPFAAPPSAKKPAAASSMGKPDDDQNPFGDFDAAPGKAVTVPPQCVTAKTCAAAKKARPQAITPSPRPSWPASMKITVGKASSRSAAAELAASEETIEKALLRPVTLDVVETPLDKFAEQLARQFSVNVIVDQKVLCNVGIGVNLSMTCKVSNLPLRYALDELLRPLNLVWTIRNGVLLVTTPEEAEKQLTTKIYDVSSLLVNPPDYPASRSNDLGDPDPLFGPLPETNGPGGIGVVNGFGYGMAGGGPFMGGMGAGGGLFSVSGQSGSPPILQQRAEGGMCGTPSCVRQVSRANTSPLDFDSLIDSITSTIESHGLGFRGWAVQHRSPGTATTAGRQWPKGDPRESCLLP